MKGKHRYYRECWSCDGRFRIFHSRRRLFAWLLFSRDGWRYVAFRLDVWLGDRLDDLYDRVEMKCSRPMTEEERELFRRPGLQEETVQRIKAGLPLSEEQRKVWELLKGVGWA